MAEIFEKEAGVAIIDPEELNQDQLRSYIIFLYDFFVRNYEARLVALYKIAIQNNRYSISQSEMKIRRRDLINVTTNHPGDSTLQIIQNLPAIVSNIIETIDDLDILRFVIALEPLELTNFSLARLLLHTNDEIPKMILTENFKDLFFKDLLMDDSKAMSRLLNSLKLDLQRSNTK